MSIEHRGKWKRTLWLTGAGFSALAAYNALVAWQTPRPSHRVDGLFDRYPAREGDLAYTVSGSTTGMPIVLLHGLRPGDSMNEWSEVAALLGATHPVYALDLPGFGLSPGKRPTVASLTEALCGFLRDVVGGPCALVAANGSAAVATIAAQRDESRVADLILVCPPAPPPSVLPSRDVLHEALNENASGVVLGKSHAEASLLQRILEGDPSALRRAVLPRLLSLPVIGRTTLLAMLSPGRLRKWGRAHGFFDKARVDEMWLHGALRAARHSALQGAGKVAATGELDAPWADAWRDLDTPGLLIWGRHAVADEHGGGLEVAPELLALRPDVRLEVVDQAMLLPHVERPEVFVASLERWLSGEVDSSSGSA